MVDLQLLQGSREIQKDFRIYLNPCHLQMLVERDADEAAFYFTNFPF